MVDDMLQHSRPLGVEVIPSGRRRRWSDAQKAEIVAESLIPGAVVAEVARRHEIAPQHLTTWRTAAKRGLLALPACNDLEFARVVVSDAADPWPAVSLEVRIGAAVIPVHRGTDLAFLREVVRALKAVA
jgi:transposase